jgi:putative transposase
MIAINDVLEPLTESGPFEKPARVLWINSTDDVVTLMTVVEPPYAPWHMRLSELKSLLELGRIRPTKVRTPSFMLKLEEDLSEKKKAIRQKNWERIRPLVETAYPGEIHYPNSMGRMVAAHAKGTGLDRKTIYQLLYRYWLYGSTQNALLPKSENSGAAGKSRVFVNGKVPGRPPKYLGEAAETRAKILTDEDKQIIKIGFALYRDNKTKSIADAYIKTLNRYYRLEHPSPDGSDDDIRLKPMSELPNEVQFSYWGKKAYDDISVLHGRSGERKWAMNHRPLVGRSHDRLHGPCHRFEIDATIADIYLVSRYNRAWLIGRPIVYVVVDVFSRMIVGVYVGLEGPSWNGARHALFNAFSDKVDFCAKHGITITQEEWPCHHLPQELVADRGEMLGAAANGIVTGLNINLAIMPPFRPDWKAIVESKFRLLNQMTQMHWSPGGVRTRMKERGERDYRLDATLDLEEFTRIIIKSVLHYNRYSRAPDRLNPAMIAEDVQSTPIGIWNWGIEQGMGEPNMQSDDSVYLHLLPRERATIQARGISFKGMHYLNPLDLGGMKAAHARAFGRQAIDIWHEPGTVDHIWIQAPNKSFVKCMLPSTEGRYQNRRLEEVLDMLEITKQLPSQTKYDELNSRVQLDEFVESTIATAAAEKKESNIKKSKAAQIADIRANRTLERTAERVIAAHQSPAAPSLSAPSIDRPRSEANASAQTYAGERGGEVIDLLSRLYERSGQKK